MYICKKCKSRQNAYAMSSFLNFDSLKLSAVVKTNPGNFPSLMNVCTHTLVCIQT